MKVKLSFILFLGLSNLLLSQNVNLDSLFEPKLKGELFEVKAGFVGNEFNNNEWTLGDIQFNSGETAHNKLMKYDILLDELIWLQPNGFTKVKLEKHFISFFRFKGPNGNIISFKRIRVKLPDVGDSTDIFAEVLVQKKASLFAFRTARIEDNLQMVNGVQCQVKSIIPDNKYFVFLPSRQIIVLRKTSKHAVLKGMPENYRSIIKDIIKANNLSLKSENDLVRLVGLIEG